MKNTIITFILLIFYFIGMSQGNTWTQIADCGEELDHAVGFSINGKGYAVAGLDSNMTNTNTCWEYDPVINLWTKKSNFPGAARAYAVGFSIGSFGYVATGANQTTLFSEVWQYNPISDTWLQKNDFPGGARYQAVAITIGNKAYLGTGYTFFNDWWEYDPVQDLWTQKTHFPGAPRGSMSGFSIGHKGYIGLGRNSSSYFDDFYEYDSDSDKWTQKANYGGGTNFWAAGFAIDSIGYIGNGEAPVTNAFYEYSPTLDLWNTKANVGGGMRHMPVFFVLDCIGYIVAGYGSGGPMKDGWKYTPNYTCQTTSISEEKLNQSTTISPNPFSDNITITTKTNQPLEITLYDLTSRALLKQTFTNTTTINASQLASGIYLYQVRNNKGIIKNGKVVKE